jgi:hypothetical protein
MKTTAFLTASAILLVVAAPSLASCRHGYELNHEGRCQRGYSAYDIHHYRRDRVPDPYAAGFNPKCRADNPMTCKHGY